MGLPIGDITIHHIFCRWPSYRTG